jgi:hypothetical protein
MEYSFSGRLFGFIFLAATFGVFGLLVSSTDLAESNPLLTTTTAPRSTSTTQDVAAPGTSTTTDVTSTSCEVVIVESVFNEQRLVEVLAKGADAGLNLEALEQNSQVTIAFVRYETEVERDSVLEAARDNGWADAYLWSLSPPECEEES